MKVFLLHRDRDFDWERELPANADALAQDLELETLWNAMADGDEHLHEVAQRVLLLGLEDPDEIRYRQEVLADCIDRADVVRELYALAVEGVRAEKEVRWFWSSDSPERILHRSVSVLELHVAVLRRMRRLVGRQRESFASPGFRRLFAAVEDELGEDYLQAVEQHLKQLQFKRGVLMSAELGKGHRGRRYVVRTPREQSWTERLSLANRTESHSFTIPERDENGFRALGEIRDKGLNEVANALAQASEHVKSFFALLQAELGFYLGCLNLRERLIEKEEPHCLPEPLPAGDRSLAARGLYDVCLSLHLEQRAVGNDVDAEGKQLVVVTGANQGGKSTFLRSVGVAQLMLQAGMFVGAEAFRATVCSGVFTHHKREEDEAMESGKLDEELARMSAIADLIRPGGLLLCNESFASTNEREGSEIARRVVRALLARRIGVVYVTHLYDLAHGFHVQDLDTALFLRAERGPDGSRTFRVSPGEPLPTSHGEDSYRRIFGRGVRAVG